MDSSDETDVRHRSPVSAVPLLSGTLATVRDRDRGLRIESELDESDNASSGGDGRHGACAGFGAGGAMFPRR